ncbi:MAG: PhzF family phenazine biosynthesis protein [Chloroflexi bacterium]|nr:PhzF family phenazine biosynthesis protein [Chloroflexota bacterium]
MSRRPLHLLDVFAERPMEGNLHAVILDADGVTDEQMARLSRRLRLSETSFVQTATLADASYRHRIWTVAGEIPFAGHPSIGTAVSVAIERGLQRADFIQQTLVGLQALHVSIAADNQAGTATLVQGPLVLGEVVDPGPILIAFGLQATDAHPDLPAQLVSTGLASVVLPVRDIQTLGRARMDPVAVRAALAPIADPDRLNCYFVTPLDAFTWRARSLALDIAGWEDPATGSAAGPFGAWLSQLGGPSRVTVLQGVEMGDPSRIEDDVSEVIVIGGRVLVRSVGTIEL